VFGFDDNSVVALVEGSVRPVDNSVVALVEGSVTALDGCSSAPRIEGFRSMAFASSTCAGAESCGALLRSVDADWGGGGRGESPVNRQRVHSK
jgi:hypothetical protein